MNLINEICKFIRQKNLSIRKYCSIFFSCTLVLNNILPALSISFEEESYQFNQFNQFNQFPSSTHNVISNFNDLSPTLIAQENEKAFDINLATDNEVFLGQDDEVDSPTCNTVSLQLVDFYRASPQIKNSSNDPFSSVTFSTYSGNQTMLSELDHSVNAEKLAWSILGYPTVFGLTHNGDGKFINVTSSSSSVKNLLGLPSDAIKSKTNILGGFLPYAKINANGDEIVTVGADPRAGGNKPYLYSFQGQGKYNRSQETSGSKYTDFVNGIDVSPNGKVFLGLENGELCSLTKTQIKSQPFTLGKIKYFTNSYNNYFEVDKTSNSSQVFGVAGYQISDTYKYTNILSLLQNTANPSNQYGFTLFAIDQNSPSQVLLGKNDFWGENLDKLLGSSNAVISGLKVKNGNLYISYFVNKGVDFKKFYQENIFKYKTWIDPTTGLPPSAFNFKEGLFDSRLAVFKLDISGNKINLIKLGNVSTVFDSPACSGKSYGISGPIDVSSNGLIFIADKIYSNVIRVFKMDSGVSQIVPAGLPVAVPLTSGRITESFNDSKYIPVGNNFAFSTTISDIAVNPGSNILFVSLPYIESEINKPSNIHINGFLSTFYISDSLDKCSSIQSSYACTLDNEKKKIKKEKPKDEDLTLDKEDDKPQRFLKQKTYEDIGVTPGIPTVEIKIPVKTQSIDNALSYNKGFKTVDLDVSSEASSSDEIKLSAGARGVNFASLVQLKPTSPGSYGFPLVKRDAISLGSGKASRTGINTFGNSISILPGSSKIVALSSGNKVFASRTDEPLLQTDFAPDENSQTIVSSIPKSNNRFVVLSSPLDSTMPDQSSLTFLSIDNAAPPITLKNALGNLEEQSITVQSRVPYSLKYKTNSLQISDAKSMQNQDQFLGLSYYSHNLKSKGIKYFLDKALTQNPNFTQDNESNLQNLLSTFQGFSVFSIPAKSKDGETAETISNVHKNFYLNDLPAQLKSPSQRIKRFVAGATIFQNSMTMDTFIAVSSYDAKVAGNVLLQEAPKKYDSSIYTSLKPPGLISNNLIYSLDAKSVTNSGQTAKDVSKNAVSTWENLSGSNPGAALKNIEGSDWIGNGSASNPFALSFDGEDNFVSVPVSVFDGIRKSNSYSIEVVFNLNSDHSDFVSLFSRGLDQRILIDPNNNIVVNTYNKDTTNTGVKVLPNEWHDVVLSKDDTNQARLFLDGVLVWEAAKGRIFDKSKAISIGASQSQNPYLFAGQISAVRIYDKALSENDVKQNYDTEIFRFNSLETIATLNGLKAETSGRTSLHANRVNNPPVLSQVLDQYLDDNKTFAPFFIPSKDIDGDPLTFVINTVGPLLGLNSSNANGDPGQKVQSFDPNDPAGYFSDRKKMEELELNALKNRVSYSRDVFRRDVPWHVSTVDVSTDGGYFSNNLLFSRNDVINVQQGNSCSGLGGVCDNLSPCCLPYNCDNSTMTCVGGLCMVDGDCSVIGQTCVSGTCTCSAPGSNVICANSCQSGNCCTADQCAQGQACVTYSCSDGCTQNSDCRSGESCNNLMCVAGCSGDNDCMSPTPHCLSGVCLECFINDHCGNGQNCSNNMCVCSAGQVFCNGMCEVGNCCDGNDCPANMSVCEQHTCVECSATNNPCTAPRGVCSSANLCVECNEGANDCQSNDKPICSGNICVGCMDNSDCNGHPPICSNGSCVECAVNGDCLITNNCQNNMCVCPSGQVLCNGMCEVGNCCEDNQCGNSVGCFNNMCACLVGQVYCNGTCTAGNCCANGDCTNGLVCSNNTCVECVAHSDCPSNKPVCKSNSCKECDSSDPLDVNCMNGQVCVNDACANLCGNSMIDAGEDCDDGNSINSDYCTNTCMDGFCGDGVLCSDVPCGGIIEACDDGNMINGDGCNNSCQIEACMADTDCANDEVCTNGSCSKCLCTFNMGAQAFVGNSFCALSNNILASCDQGAPHECSPSAVNCPQAGTCTENNNMASCGSGCMVDADCANDEVCTNSMCGKCSCSINGDQVALNDYKCDGGVRKQCSLSSPHVCIGDAVDSCVLGSMTTCVENLSAPYAAHCRSCPDGIADAPEECDDGNSANNDACVDICMNAVCGDMHTWTGVEECDDGNSANGDGCSSTCMSEGCMSDTDCANDEKCVGGMCEFIQCMVDADCRNVLPHCGAGHCYQCADDSHCMAGESCVNNMCAGPGSGCMVNADCPPLSPACNGFGMCSCHPAACSNVVGAMICLNLERCVECAGNNDCNNGLICVNNSCVVNNCGNSMVDAGEECDDGNQVNTDNCSNICMFAACGDGILGNAVGENCDDGNNVSGDGCSQLCQNEGCMVDGDCANDEVCTNGMCEKCSCTFDFNAHGLAGSLVLGQTKCNPLAITPSRYECESIASHSCGIRNNGCDLGEVCVDDNSTVTASCRVNNCGNGMVDQGEECDDGNNTVGDGCSTCMLEAGSCMVDGDCAFNEKCTNGMCATVTCSLVQFGLPDIGINDEICNQSNNTPIVCSNSSAHSATLVQRSSCDSGQQCIQSSSTHMASCCGDGIRDQLTEECDDGNLGTGDGCNGACMLEGCMVDGDCANDEVCTNSMCEKCSCTISGKAVSVNDTVCENATYVSCFGSTPHMCVISPANNCLAPRTQCVENQSAPYEGRCVEPLCGNSMIDAGEECDDGNQINTDDCLNSCMSARCGDGFIQAGLSENCDDGNTTNGDGCNSTCMSEGCMADVDCMNAASPHCSNGACVACTQNNHCGVGSNCQNNTCVDSNSCSSNQDCGNGKVCCSGSCKSGTCCTNSDCGAGKVCTNNSCVNAPACMCGSLNIGQTKCNTNKSYYQCTSAGGSCNLETNQCNVNQVCVNNNNSAQCVGGILSSSSSGSPTMVSSSSSSGSIPSIKKPKPPSITPLSGGRPVNLADLGLNFDIMTGRFSGKTNSISDRFNTTYSRVPITVYATDGKSQSNEVSFNLIIRSSNHNPILINPGDRVYTEGKSIVLNLIATDEDKDNLAYYVDSLPDGLSLDHSTGVISGEVGEITNGSDPILFPVKAYVWDGHTDGFSQLISFSITVKPRNKNISQKEIYLDGTLQAEEKDIKLVQFNSFNNDNDGASRGSYGSSCISSIDCLDGLICCSGICKSSIFCTDPNMNPGIPSEGSGSGSSNPGVPSEGSGSGSSNPGVPSEGSGSGSSNPGVPSEGSGSGSSNPDLPNQRQSCFSRNECGFNKVCCGDISSSFSGSHLPDVTIHNGFCYEGSCCLDLDCPSGGACVNHFCTTPINNMGSCSHDVDCPSGSMCVGLVCVPNPNNLNCSNDTDCMSGELCIDRNCKIAECRTDVDCGSGKVCKDYFCEDLMIQSGCSKDTDCMSGELCIDRSCKIAECRTDVDCGSGKVCKDYFCEDLMIQSGCSKDTDCMSGELCIDSNCKVAECRADEDCGSGKVCKDYFCEDLMIQSGCSKDTDCMSGELCIDSNCEVAECRADEDCGSGKVCKDNFCKEIDSESTETSGACHSNSECSSHLCCSNKCATGNCCSDKDCGSGSKCQDNLCISSVVIENQKIKDDISPGVRFNLGGLISGGTARGYTTDEGTSYFGSNPTNHIKELKCSINNKPISLLSSTDFETVYGGVKFDASKDQKIKLPLTGTFDKWAIELLVRLDDKKLGRDQILFKGNDFGLYVADGFLKFYGRNAAGSDVKFVSNKPLPFNTWNYITISTDGNNSALYVNGDYISSGKIGSFDFNNALVGGDFAGNTLSGSIAKVAVYNRSLTSQEINKNNRYRLDPSDNRGLLGYWNFLDIQNNESVGFKDNANSYSATSSSSSTTSSSSVPNDTEVEEISPVNNTRPNTQRPEDSDDEEASSTRPVPPPNQGMIIPAPPSAVPPSQGMIIPPPPSAVPPSQGMIIPAPPSAVPPNQGLINAISSNMSSSFGVNSFMSIFAARTDNESSHLSAVLLGFGDDYKIGDGAYAYAIKQYDFAVPSLSVGELNKNHTLRCSATDINSNSTNDEIIGTFIIYGDKSSVPDEESDTDQSKTPTTISDENVIPTVIEEDTSSVEILPCCYCLEGKVKCKPGIEAFSLIGEVLCDGGNELVTKVGQKVIRDDISRRCVESNYLISIEQGEEPKDSINNSVVEEEAADDNLFTPVGSDNGFLFSKPDMKLETNIDKRILGRTAHFAKQEEGQEASLFIRTSGFDDKVSCKENIGKFVIKGFDPLSNIPTNFEYDSSKLTVYKVVEENGSIALKLVTEVDTSAYLQDDCTRTVHGAIAGPVLFDKSRQELIVADSQGVNLAKTYKVNFSQKPGKLKLVENEKIKVAPAYQGNVTDIALTPSYGDVHYLVFSKVFDKNYDHNLILYPLPEGGNSISPDVNDGNFVSPPIFAPIIQGVPSGVNNQQEESKNENKDENKEENKDEQKDKNDQDKKDDDSDDVNDKNDQNTKDNSKKPDLDKAGNEDPSGLDKDDIKLKPEEKKNKEREKEKEIGCTESKDCIKYGANLFCVDVNSKGICIDPAKKISKVGAVRLNSCMKNEVKFQGRKKSELFCVPTRAHMESKPK